jgi:hypothetical protein
MLTLRLTTWTWLRLRRDCDSVLRMMTKNPFPGMNPFFEQQWRDAHLMLIAYLRDTLSERLPPDLVARVEEEEALIVGNHQKTYRPDVTVREPWTLKEPGVATVASSPPQPVRVSLEDEVERWLEIREANGRLITVIELISPSNKIPSDDRERYLRKRRSFIEARANLVEIDLIRQGPPVFPAPVRRLLEQKNACYGVAVLRATRPSEQEVYPIPLRDRLPAISVPLRPTDPDVILDLQPLIDQCHERGRYHLLNYQLQLAPALSSDDAVWVDALLHQHGLR